MADGVDVGERIGRRRILEDVAGIQRRFSRQVGQRRGHEGQAFGDERDLGDPELRLPGDNVAGRVEPSGDVDERRRALGIPAVLVVPHPLHAHGPSHLAREQRGVGGRVLVAVAAIATGAVEVETARSEEHTSELQSQSNLVCRLLLEKKKKSYYAKDTAIEDVEVS